MLTDGAYTLHCKHCGDTPTLPVPVDLYVAMARAYVRNHRACPPPKESP